MGRFQSGWGGYGMESSHYRSPPGGVATPLVSPNASGTLPKSLQKSFELGMTHERFTYKYQGLDQKLTGVEEAKVIGSCSAELA